MADSGSAPEPSLADVRRLSPNLSLANRGTGALREMILGGILRPGQRLNEVELSAALGISRAPLREAIRDLASQGLLTIVTHKGAFVPSYTSDDLREIYEARIAVETHAVRLLARRHSAADLAELHALLDQTQQTICSSGSAAYPSELDFHGRVMELTGNRHLVEISTSVGRKIQLERVRSGHVPERAQEALNEHREIANCISDSDANAAAVLMMRHLQLSLANALRISQTSGDVEAPLSGEARGGSSA